MIHGDKSYITLPHYSVTFYNAVVQMKIHLHDHLLHQLATFPFIHFLPRGQKIPGKQGILISTEHLLSFQENTQTVVN